MKGYSIKEELYSSIGHRTMVCVLVLENGFEIAGTHCLDLSDLIHEDIRKQKAFQEAYNKYLFLVSAYNRQAIYGKSPFQLRTGLLGSEAHEQKPKQKSV